MKSVTVFYRPLAVFVSCAVAAVAANAASLDAKRGAALIREWHERHPHLLTNVDIEVDGVPRHAGRFIRAREGTHEIWALDAVASPLFRKGAPTTVCHDGENTVQFSASAGIRHTIGSGKESVPWGWLGCVVPDDAEIEVQQNGTWTAKYVIAFDAKNRAADTFAIESVDVELTAGADGQLIMAKVEHDATSMVLRFESRQLDPADASRRVKAAIAQSERPGLREVKTNEQFTSEILNAVTDAAPRLGL